MFVRNQPGCLRSLRKYVNHSTENTKTECLAQYTTSIASGLNLKMLGVWKKIID